MDNKMTRDPMFLDGNILTKRLDVKKNGISSKASQIKAATDVPSNN